VAHFLEMLAFSIVPCEVKAMPAVVATVVLTVFPELMILLLAKGELVVPEEAPAAPHGWCSAPGSAVILMAFVISLMEALAHLS
jgi:hypothetical protein